MGFDFIHIIVIIGCCLGIVYILLGRNVRRDRVGFRDSYKMTWKLRQPTGVEYWETYVELSLSDFEILYGNNTYEIIELKMELMK